RDQRRLGEVLTAAARQPVFRDARAYRFDWRDRSFRIGAGDVLDAFVPVARRIEEVVTTLLSRRADLFDDPAAPGGSGPHEPGRGDARAEPSGPGPAGAGGAPLEFVTVGGLGALPPARAATARAVAKAAAAAASGPVDLASPGGGPGPYRGRGPRPGRLDRPELAAARGAALLATGRVEVIERYPHAVSLRVHRIRHGLLASADLVLTAADDDARGHAGDAGPLGQPGQGSPGEPPEPPVLRVNGSHEGTIVADVREDGGTLRTLRLRADRLPPGEYRVWVEASRSPLGSLGLRPVGGGEVWILPLEEGG
ncbi:hypothetical protein FraQA3DRAFT_4113, partial [Frankia sp. QA3]